MSKKTKMARPEKYRLWTTGVNQAEYLRNAKNEGLTRTEALKQYIGAVWDKNQTAIQNGIKQKDGNPFGLNRQEFINNIYENAKERQDKQWGVKREIKSMQLSRSYMTAEEMAKRNAEVTFRRAGNWRDLRTKLGRGDYSVEQIGDKKDKSYRYTGKKGSFIVRFNEDYNVSAGNPLYDIIDDMEEGYLPW